MKLSELEIGKTYSSQFNNYPFGKVLAKAGTKITFELYGKDKPSVIREIDDSFTVELLCYREYDPNLKSLKYDGEITKRDVETIQEYFHKKLDESLIREAINAYNWGGDYTEVFNLFGIDGDTCNTDSVARMVKDYFQIEYSWDEDPT